MGSTTMILSWFDPKRLLKSTITIAVHTYWSVKIEMGKTTMHDLKLIWSQEEVAEVHYFHSRPHLLKFEHRHYCDRPLKRRLINSTTLVTADEEICIYTERSGPQEKLWSPQFWKQSKWKELKELPRRLIKQFLRENVLWQGTQPAGSRIIRFIMY
jgi:hypothetical protein